MMASSAEQDGWTLTEATESDLEELMSWFDGSESVRNWGGPAFRFPFTRATFRADCHWGKMATFTLHAPTGEFAAFGQAYERYGRINFARLVVKPSLRGRGVGKRLISLLMPTASELWNCDEYSLFVFRDNAPALRCYQSLGFVIRQYPDDAPLADQCYYLTRPV